MGSIGLAIRGVKEDAGRLLEIEGLAQICREAGDRWRCRGPLTRPRLIQLLILQMVEGNAALRRVARWASTPVHRLTKAGVAAARKRLPRFVLVALLRCLLERAPTHGGGLWRGYRVYLMDGTGVSMPDTRPLAQFFGYPANQRPGLGFPVAHLLHRFDADTGMLCETKVGPRPENDLKRLPELLAKVEPGSLLVGDRAFGCYLALALCNERGVAGVFRPQGQLQDSFHAKNPKAKRQTPPTGRVLHVVSSRDHIVSYRRPKQRSSVVSAEYFDQMPDEIQAREIELTVEAKGFRSVKIILITNIVDEEGCTADEIGALYLRRWQAEVNIRHLKQSLRMEVLKGRSVDIVLKEILLMGIVYNLVRLVMLEAARRKRIDPDRISFVDARDWLRDSGDPDGLSHLEETPARPGRIEPRAVKRRPKPQSLLSEPRDQARRRLAHTPANAEDDEE